MKKHQCNYCKHLFSTKTNLYKHQKTTKYCLKIQDEQETIVCDYCQEKLSTKQKLYQHYPHCKEHNNYQLQDTINRYEERIAEYKEHIKTLEDRIERLALQAINKPNAKAKTITNIILTPLTTEHIQQYLPQLTREHIEAGSAGYAQFAVEYPLKDTLICVDQARKKWRFKNENGDIIDDYEGQLVTEKFFQSIVNRNEELIREYVDELMTLSQETGDINQALDLYRKITELNDTNFKCNDTANGKDTKFKRSFIIDVSKLLGKIKNIHNP